MKRSNIEMPKKSILWISSLPSKQSIEDCQKKGFTDMAGYVSQWNYIEAIEAVTNIKIDRISAIRVPGFPKYKELFVKREVSRHREGAIDINIGFFNIEHLSLFFSQIQLICEAKKWARKHKKESVYIIMESLSSRYLAAGIAIKKIISNATLCNIVTDLPQFMNRSGMSKIKQLLKKYDWNIIKKQMGKVDKFILYTKYMAEYLSLKPGKWIVIEGMPNVEKLNIEIPKKYDEFVCTYAGNLVSSMKIENIISAFLIANIPNSIFKIFGNGDSKENVIKSSKKNMCIQYCGYRPNMEVFETMMKSTLLVHPRPTKDEYNKYSCPSKLFEYMSSGTAVIGTKLKGVPDEYDKYMFIFNSDTVDDMANSLKNVALLGKEEINKVGIEARKYLRLEKNPNAQAKKLLDHIGF